MTDAGWPLVSARWRAATVAELAAIPIVGVVGPADVPGVVLTGAVHDFVSINVDYTWRVVEDIGRLATDEAVLVEAPPGAGKRSLAIDELRPEGRALTTSDVAVIAAHNDQVHAVRYALAHAGVDPDSLVVSTANKVQGREYEVVLVWHPLAGRRDATAFHLEAGRMCVMLSRHRQACIVVGRAGADRLLAEFPDADPIFLDEPEKFPDGWEANSLVLDHLAGYKVDQKPTPKA